jgi:bacillolysin
MPVNQMVYGDGESLADDTVAHELTHGVTDFEADLFTYYQSGAINESMSDVFGEFVDLTNARGNDAASVRWLVAEDGLGGTIRNMKDPTLSPSPVQPDKMTSPNYFAGANTEDANGRDFDQGGVHVNSGVGNKAAYLITDGATFNGKTVTGLGIDKAARIYYETLTNLLTSGSDYADLYATLPQACTNLTGTAGITATDCQEVRDAVAATEMNLQSPNAPAPEAPVCASG